MAQKYYEGYLEAKQKVEQEYSPCVLYQLLDDLFGRDNLPKIHTFRDLKNEALRQLEVEWMTPEGKQTKEDNQALASAIIANHQKPKSFISRNNSSSN